MAGKAGRDDEAPQEDQGLQVGGSAQSPREASPSMRPPAILVVDDEPEVAALLAEILHRHGYRVETAADGEIALAMVRQRLYDVIVSDVRMPNMAGPELYRALVAGHRRLLGRVIFLTGDILNPQTQAFLQQTGAPIVGKPFTLEALCRAVEQVLRTQT